VHAGRETLVIGDSTQQASEDRALVGGERRADGIVV
jgi:hypothetical protein